MTRITGGFIIVRQFEDLYETFAKPWPGPDPLYGIPTDGIPVEKASKRYHGIDRDPLWAETDADEELFGEHGRPRPEPDAQNRLSDLENVGSVVGGIVLGEETIRSVVDRLRDPKAWEVIWVADWLTEPSERGKKFPLLGYEPTYLTSDHFSAIADCLFFPRWHGTDEEGEAFGRFFDSLNDDGLFDSPVEAVAFLHHYWSFDWTEHSGDFSIAEIRDPSGLLS